MRISSAKAVEQKAYDTDSRNQLDKTTSIIQSVLTENHQKLLNDAIYGVGECQKQIRNVIKDIIRHEKLDVPDMSIDEIAWGVYKFIIGYDVIHDLLLDTEITEICVNGPYQITYKKNGIRYFAKDIKFTDLSHLEKITERILLTCHSEANEGSPMVDNAWLPDRSRVVINKSSIVPSHGITLNIRRFRDKNFSLEELEKIGTLKKAERSKSRNSLNKEYEEIISILSEEHSYRQLDFIRDVVRAGATIIVSGGTHTGKTTLIRTLASIFQDLIPDENGPGDPESGLRIITIENGPELQLVKYYPGLEVVEMLERDTKYNPIGVEDIYPQVMRMDPDVILVGEIRFPVEAMYTLRAMRSGHANTMASIHTYDAESCCQELRTKVQAISNVSDKVINTEIVTAVDIIIQLGIVDRKIEITQVAELDLDPECNIVIKDIFKRDSDGKMIFNPISKKLAYRLIAKGRKNAGDVKRWLV
ncbi:MULTISPECIES: ATPase, T2SS/T4P/T4SS family [Dehalobacter]|jgi:pilus assembly protein CpaF|uniref:CpaF family protein n=2 Tax=Dehalobacter restrictus TaxID=55583 RepID=A0A857DH57_9FIRM|nr:MULTISPECIES: ATPase, T2SS/T4P/T4SS family [Dehalobacter]AHF09038.1 pilus assembly protein [Dehalobacter restrictus DSM 9455]MCG1024955.1 CpaF family protein [Dehalobacter sp.]QGZ99565.1 CpaF family protein [Dehalobacter restrictus]